MVLFTAFAASAAAICGVKFNLFGRGSTGAHISYLGKATVKPVARLHGSPRATMRMKISSHERFTIFHDRLIIYVLHVITGGNTHGLYHGRENS